MKNGNSTEATAPAEAKPRGPDAARYARFAQNFSNIIAVLMRDPGFKNLRLADLEWLVLPAVMSGQWRVAQTTLPPAQDGSGAGAATSGMIVPTAVALWAQVSPAIDARLSANLDQPLILRANEWVSGDIFWLIAVAGDKRVVPHFVEQLFADVFKDKLVKSRVLGPDGNVMVKTQGQAT